MMDVERQVTQSDEEFTLKGVKKNIQEKAKHPTVSATLIVFLVLNVIMLITGFMHVKDCPIKKMIPIYLIVAGFVGIVSKLLPFVNRKFEKSYITYTIYALYIFEFIWMLLGSYWVYSIHKPSFDKRLSLHCDKTAYYLAFWLLTLNWFFILITIILACCAGCCIALLARDKSTS